MQDKKDASAPLDTLSNEGSLPFFTRFLEGQHNTGEGIWATTKHPSDLDEAFTNKYPSDGDDTPYPPEDGIL